MARNGNEDGHVGQYAVLMLNKAAFNTSEVCRAYGINHAILSPGSRNAPLLLSFARNNQMKKWIIPDERAAGFIALGIAQQIGKPVALCCTSGTALLNYAPAVAEAYYRQIPLIVLSADRPPELIDQRDGQTIRQFEALKNHVKKSVQLPLILDTESEDGFTCLLKSTLAVALQEPTGPAHINIPFKEPFYPTASQELHFEAVEKEHAITEKGSVHFPNIDFKGKKVLMVIGQKGPDENLDKELDNIGAKIPIIHSPLSNVAIDGIGHVDFFLDNRDKWKPDILVTTGLSVLSKKLKNFLRKNTPFTHLHFDPAGVPVDTYRSKPQWIKAPLEDYLNTQNFDVVDAHFCPIWKERSEKVNQLLKENLIAEFSETKAFDMVLKQLPPTTHLHLSNSMPVRFADMFGISNSIQVYANRGTSGIDGCTSTALGASLVADQLTILITGDLAFLYDRNAFFHNYGLDNLRIIVSNNQGGGIFRLIEGSAGLPELNDYFETRHNRTAKYICQENSMEYRTARSENEMEKNLKGFFDPSGRPILLEIFTDPKTNERTFKAFEKNINERLNN